MISLMFWPDYVCGSFAILFADRRISFSNLHHSQRVI